MNKTEIRRYYKDLRRELTEEMIEDLSFEIANQLLKLPIWDFINYHLFLPIKTQNEVNTEFILQILLGKDKNTIISKSNFETFEMTHYILTDSTILKNNAYGIPEPTNAIEVGTTPIEVVFVPLLAFDVYGNRVGYGKGFYDRFLKTCKPDVLKIGLSFFEATQEHIESGIDDVRLDMCITPKGVY
ncbi:MAG: 5-formyltetrahydrofolate cyclo-ligase, partial [Flavobacterium sp.]|nr:5-formyltetrahydrofolate cyclo-ligase [Candidatus Neoflavobacterium equi]